MNLFYLSGLSVFVTSLVLVFIFAFYGKTKIHKLWIFFNLVTCVWGIGTFMAGNTSTESEALIYWKVAHVGGFFISIVFYHMVCLLCETKCRKTLVFAYLYVFLLQLLNITGVLFSDIHFIPKFGIYYPKVTNLIYPLAFTPWLIFVLMIYVKLIQYYRTTSGVKRNQTLYIFIGALFGFLGGSSTLLPIFGISIYPLGNYGIVISTIIVAYAIFKYRLMDIDLGGRYILSYLSYGVISLGIFLPFIILFSRQLLWRVLTIVFLAILIAPYLHRYLIKFFQPAFLGKKYSYWDKLRDFWEKERVVFTSGQLTEALKEIPEVMGLESFSFFLFNRDRKVFVPEAYAGLDGVFSPDPEQAKVLNTIYLDDYLTLYLEKEERIVMRDELDPIKDKDVIAQMDGIKARISAPLFVGGRLTAILNLGPKQRGEMFHEQDMALIKEVVRTAEKHLGHIAFFESSVYHSGGIAHDIKSSLREARIYSYMGDIYNGLKELKDSQQKDISLRALGNMERDVKRFQKMIDMMMDIHTKLKRFITGQLAPKIIDHNKKIMEIVNLRRKEAQEKGIALKAILPPKTLFIYAELEDVERILNELITNALKYTKEGHIEIELLQESPLEVITQVTDTGCGIPKEKYEDIFKPFTRLKINEENAEGVGLGLAVSRQLVEANAGRLFLKYSQPGKGSSFWLVLPTPEGAGVKDSG